MEKEKRKDNQAPFFKTPVGSCCFSIIQGISVTIILIPLSVVIGIVLFVFWDN
jgi:hypothetical protein